MGLEIFARGELPRWAPVRQTLDATREDDVAAAVAREFARPELADTILPGQRVAFTGGSRGIDRIAEVLRATAAEVRRRGAEPFVVPAMGSHGGATAEGQTALLAHYGVTEEYLGCPVHSSMDTVLLGHVEDGVPVWFDRTAHENADVVIPVNRVKPHTDFHGPVESGLLKMIAIGLGKQKGADTFHARGFAAFPRLIPAVAAFTLGRVPIPFGLALVENGHGELACVEALPAAGMRAREEALVRHAARRMGRLLGERIDVLLIDRLGKDISGIGADTNVVNRYYDGPTGETPLIQRLVIRDLTPDTEGNACGIGLAEFALRRAVEKIDPVKTAMNSVTAKSPEGARTPLALDTDREALAIALASCVDTEPESARIVRIRDTKHVETFWASEPLLPELLATGRVEQLGEPEPVRYDAAGMLPDE